MATDVIWGIHCPDSNASLGTTIDKRFPPWKREPDRRYRFRIESGGLKNLSNTVYCFGDWLFHRSLALQIVAEFPEVRISEIELWPQNGKAQYDLTKVRRDSDRKKLDLVELWTTCAVIPNFSKSAFRPNAGDPSNGRLPDGREMVWYEILNADYLMDQMMGRLSSIRTERSGIVIDRAAVGSCNLFELDSGNEAITFGGQVGWFCTDRFKTFVEAIGARDLSFLHWGVIEDSV